MYIKYIEGKLTAGDAETNVNPIAVVEVRHGTLDMSEVWGRRAAGRHIYRCRRADAGVCSYDSPAR